MPIFLCAVKCIQFILSNKIFPMKTSSSCSVGVSSSSILSDTVPKVYIVVFYGE